MAADVLSEAGVSVIIADRMPTPARQFLMAGKSGLNLTNTGDAFVVAYGDVSPAGEVMQWTKGPGQPVVVGSARRVTPPSGGVRRGACGRP